MCAVIVSVILFENSFFMNKINGEPTDGGEGFMRFSRKHTLEVPFMPRRQNILLLGVDSNGANTDMW